MKRTLLKASGWLVLSVIGMLIALYLKRKVIRRNETLRKPELFTDDFISALPALNWFSPIVLLICRDALPSNIARRNYIERRFALLQPKDKASMKSRLRSLKDEVHLPAFFELVLEDFFCSRKFAVEKEPVLDDGKTPDLKLTLDTEECFVEIRTIVDTEESRKNKRAMSDALNQINKLRTPYALSVHFESNPKTPSKPTVLRESIKAWLHDLKIEPGKRQSQMFDIGGYELTVNAYSCEGWEVSNDRVFSSQEPVATLGASMGLMVGGVRSKYRKYKKLRTEGVPYVIAICSTDDNPVLEDIWMTLAAYGSLAGVQNSHGVLEVMPGLSGILHCQLLQGKDTLSATVKYLPNPTANAQAPFELSDFTKQFLLN